MFDVFTSLVNAFCGPGPANVSSQEFATRTVLHAKREREFELTICVPRHGAGGRQVRLEVVRAEEDARFSANEAAAVLRAYRASVGGVVGQENSVGQFGRPASPVPTKKGGGAPGSPVSPDGTRSVYYSQALPQRSLDGGDLQVGEKQAGDGEWVAAVAAKLEELGAEVFVPREDHSWADLAGYENVKNVIQESVVLPLTHPEIYEGIVRETRKKYENVLPRAVLFTGLPGCGKSTAARILASAIGVPFVNLRVEALLSKYYGETTKRLAEILETTQELGPCVLFCDEIDSLGASRDDPEAHEVTRRTLSVLLRHLDGLDGAPQSILVAATNVEQMLDAALMSRFDVVIPMELPDAPTRAAILGQYAQQLSQAERDQLATVCDGFSGRELRDACKAAERACAGRAVRAAAEAKGSTLGALNAKAMVPEFKDYVEALRQKARTSVGATARKKPYGFRERA